mgnify:CR=1 FL=1
MDVKKQFAFKKTGITHSTEYEWYKSSKIIYDVGTILLLVLPIFAGNYMLHIFILSLLFAIFALSWNLIVGYSGIVSFGHQAFFGIGAYVSALLSMHFGLSPWLGVIAGGLMAAIAGGIISLPVLRLKAAPYIAILTLGFAEIVRLVISNLTEVTRGEMGLSGIPAFSSIGPVNFSLAHRINIYFLLLMILLLIIFVMTRLINGPRGLALKSIRESQDAAESLGVNLTKNKLYVFTISAFIAGMSGAIYAHYVQVLTPSSVIGIDIMLQILVITIIGGLGTIAGPVVGSFIVVTGLEYLRFLGDFRLIVYGLVLILFIMFMPEGIVRKLFPKSNV